MNEHIKVYRDAAGKWRWKWVRGTRTAGASSQGYSNKWNCMENLRLTFSANYEVTFQSKKGTPTGAMYQQGVLSVPGTNRSVFVEVVPWGADEYEEWTERRRRQVKQKEAKA